MQCLNSEVASARNLECVNTIHLSVYLDDSRYGAFVSKLLLKVCLCSASLLLVLLIGASFIYTDEFRMYVDIKSVKFGGISCAAIREGGIRVYAITICNDFSNYVT